MGYIRLYRRFYNIISKGIENQTYTLININQLSAKVYIYNTNTLVETTSEIVNESTGIYYANLNSKLYSFDNVYDLVWSVNYIETAPIKKLKTTFKIQPVVIGSDIDVDYTQNTFDFEINQQEITVEIDENVSTELDIGIDIEKEDNNIQIEILNQ